MKVNITGNVTNQVLEVSSKYQTISIYGDLGGGTLSISLKEESTFITYPELSGITSITGGLTLGLIVPSKTLGITLSGSTTPDLNIKTTDIEN